MRVFSATVVLSTLASPAFAASVPISGQYGDCLPDNPSRDSEGFYTGHLDATGYYNGEMECTAVKVRGIHVTFSCPGEDPGPNDKPELIKTTVVENIKAGTVTIIGIDTKPIVVHRCK